MQLSVIVTSFVLVTSVITQDAGFNAVTAPTLDEVVTAGSTFIVIWQAPEKYRSGTVSIDLIGGDSPDTLTPAVNLASGVDNSAEKFDWVVDSSLGDEKTYGFKFTLDSDPSVFQYSMPFKIDNSGSGYQNPASTVQNKIEPTPTATLPSKAYSSSNTTTEAPKRIFNGTVFRVPDNPKGIIPSSINPLGPAPNVALGAGLVLPRLMLAGALIAIF